MNNNQTAHNQMWREYFQTKRKLLRLLMLLWIIASVLLPAIAYIRTGNRTVLFSLVFLILPAFVLLRDKRFFHRQEKDRTQLHGHTGSAQGIAHIFSLGLGYTIVVFIILLSILLFHRNPFSSGDGSGNGSTVNCGGINVTCNSSNNSNSGGSTSTSSSMPLAAPTSSSVSSPISEPRTYKADWSKGLDGWVLSGDWSSSGGMLVNNGSDYNNDGHPTAIAPIFPQDIVNYSVQTDIRLDRYTDEGNISGEAGFGLVVRSPDQIAGYKLGVCASGGIYSCGNTDHELILSDSFIFQSSPIKQTPFRPTEGAWYTYRIDVQGNTIKAWVNGGMVFQVTDDKYLSAGSIGLWSDRSQVSVRNFTIIAL